MFNGNYKERIETDLVGIVQINTSKDKPSPSGHIKNPSLRSKKKKILIFQTFRAEILNGLA